MLHIRFYSIGNFTIQQDMKIFCFAIHNDQRGIIKQNVVLLKQGSYN